jgi:prolyl oligopeptidase
VPTPQTPPFTPVDDVVELLHGVEVPDPYRWLEDGASDRTRSWVAAQQARTRAYLDALPERPAVAERLREALDCGALGVIVPRGRWRLFTRRSPGMNQPALYVLDESGAERLLVDPAPRSADAASSLDWWYPSDDGEWVAFGISESGTEDSVLQVLETATGRVLDDRIPRCRLAAVAFEPGNGALLYTRRPLPGEVPAGEEAYHVKVFRHVVGTDAAADPVVYARKDKLHFPVDISISPDGRWTTILVATGTDQNEVALRDGAGGDFQTVFAVPGKQAFARFSGGQLLAVTNVGAPNYRLVVIDPADPAIERWRTLVPESEHVLVSARVTSEQLAVHHLVDCSSRLSLHDLDGAFLRPVPLPDLCTVTAIGTSSGHPSIYLSVEGFTQPGTVLHVSAIGHIETVMALSAPAGFDAARYPVRQAWCTSADGTRVPMFLVGRAAGHGTAVLTGYGGFNIARTPVWSPTILPLLESGGLFVVANLRGGSEYGEAWHAAGMRGSKQHCFDDFIAAGAWLIEQGLTSSARLGITGRSNGGLLVGAAMTQRPELFGAVWCGVPLLDMVRYEGFQVAQIWAAEYGSAADPDAFGWLHAYSPYHRVVDGVRYPPTLLTSGADDSRVDPMHARKMAARLQAANPEGLTLLRVDERAGHGQGKPISKLVEEEADAWSFLIHELGGRQ